MTCLQSILIQAHDNAVQTTQFTLSPIQYWLQSIHSTSEEVSRLQMAFRYILFPAYLIANIVTLVLGVSGLGLQVILFPFQCLYAYLNDIFATAPPVEQKNIEEPESAIEPESSSLPKNWAEILDYGRYAPSPHNMQPWLFRIESEDTVTLMYDPKRLLPGTNPTGSFMQVGFGILNETLSIAAAPLGLDVNITYLDNELIPGTDTPRPLALLKLVPRSSPEPLMRQLIVERRTSRLPYDGRPVAQDVLDELVNIAKQYGHKLEFSSDQKEVNWVIRLNANTMFYDMSKDEARNEVASWMRFTKADAVNRADGLAAYAMNVSGFLMWLFVHANWFFRLPGIYSLVRNTYEKAMSGTATVSWISGPFETQKDWDNAGHMMARLWLTMTKYGVYLHPFGSVITNPTAHEQMDQHFKNDDRQHDLWMLMRLGSGTAPPQAQRMPLSKLIVNGDAFFKPASDSDSPTSSRCVKYSCLVDAVDLGCH